MAINTSSVMAEAPRLLNAADLAQLLTDPESLAKISPEVVVTVLGMMEVLRARLLTQITKKTAQPSHTEALLDLPAVARLLGVPQSHAYELARRGDLPTIKVGAKYVRVRPHDLTAWLEQQSDRGTIRGAVKTRRVR